MLPGFYSSLLKMLKVLQCAGLELQLENNTKLLQAVALQVVHQQSRSAPIVPSAAPAAVESQAPAELTRIERHRVNQAEAQPERWERVARVAAANQAGTQELLSPASKDVTKRIQQHQQHLEGAEATGAQIWPVCCLACMVAAVKLAGQHQRSSCHSNCHHPQVIFL